MPVVNEELQQQVDGLGGRLKSDDGRPNHLRVVRKMSLNLRRRKTFQRRPAHLSNRRNRDSLVREQRSLIVRVPACSLHIV